MSSSVVQKWTSNSVLSDEVIEVAKGHEFSFAFRKQYNESVWDRQTEKQKRIALDKDRSVTVGVSSASLAETTLKTDNTVITYDGLTREIMDLTGNPDRAVIRLKNDLGFDVYLTKLQIYGNRIFQSNGKAGSLILDSLKRDDDIRRNGEIIKTISNDYIFDATQCQKIADYWYKRCGQKKHLYSLQVKGSALWYEPGEWYTLSLGGAGRNEYISATVECVSVTVQRTNGGIGTTSLLVRECMESWAKTTLYTARLVTGASPKRRTNQSNTLIVASSSFDGTYDYRCDGTSDDGEINDAINYLSRTFGGGEIKLTPGKYNGILGINGGSNIIITGCGESTILVMDSVTSNLCFNLSGYDGMVLRDFVIDFGNGFMAQAILCDDSSPVVGNIIQRIHIKNCGYLNSGTSYAIQCLGYQRTKIYDCIIDDMTMPSGDVSAIGIYGGKHISNTRVGTITKSGSGVGYGFSNCSKCQQNIVVGASTAKYYLSYSDSGSTYPCADDGPGGFNS